MEPERLATVINSYLPEMTNIAIECGGTIDKFIGDAILVFFGDPESEGDAEDALRCVEMAVRMQERVEQLQSFWKKNGVANGLRVRMGIATGYCTVGNFGSDQRLDYTVLGSPVNLAARLQGLAEPKGILLDQNTLSLVETHVKVKSKGEFIPRGFVRPVKYFELSEYIVPKDRASGRQLSHTGQRVEVNIIDSSDIRRAIEELREIQAQFQTQLDNSGDQTDH
jgi:adenylate cyclase